MLFALLMRLVSRWHEPMVASRKLALFATLHGQVLEIGPGEGLNFRYFDDTVQWTGFEPNPWLADKISLPPTARLFVRPFDQPFGEFDAVVSTLVLCSVDNPVQILQNLHKSLKPGGRLLFLEHVAAPKGTPLRRAQEKWLPLWRTCAGGCHPNRNTEQLIEQSGFMISKREHFSLPLWLASPHIIGEAIKR